MALPFLTCTTTEYICTSEENNYNGNLDSCSVITIIGSIVLTGFRYEKVIPLNKIRSLVLSTILNEGLK
jgi:hypothetical protein